jgi:glutamyl-tRNA reductase
MQLVVVGLNHKTAPLDVRERFAIPPESLAAAVRGIRERLGVASFVVSTCNRVELYAAADDAVPTSELMTRALAESADVTHRGLEAHLYAHRGEAAVRHLFRVAASLDSMVVGEPQILGQLKAAFEACRSAGLTGPALDRAAERAFFVAKKVRTQTGIGRNLVSISSVAVDLAKQIFGDLETRVAALLGAGKMAQLAARHQRRAGVGTLLVANRSFEHAQELASRLGGHPRQLDELPDLLVQADIIIASTGARRYMVGPAQMKKAIRTRKYRPIFFIDIAVPRNIDPALNALENVYVYDVDDLTAIAEENLAGRRREADLAEEMVTEQAKRFLTETARLRLKPTLVALRRKAEAIKGAEIARTLKRLGAVSDETSSALTVLADGIVNKMLHDVLTGLKRSADETNTDQVINLVRDLYRLEEDPE